MKFLDLTLLEGRVHSRRVQDTEQLSPAAVQMAGDLLRRAQDRIEVEHGLSGLPPFYVRLGMPPEYPPADGYELIYCVGAPGFPPFQYNALVHPDTPREPALWALSTVLGVSCVGGEHPGPAALDETVEPLWEDRPVLATALLPLADPETIRVAADFSTCFAAAWLREQASPTSQAETVYLVALDSLALESGGPTYYLKRLETPDVHATVAAGDAQRFGGPAEAAETLRLLARFRPRLVSFDPEAEPAPLQCDFCSETPAVDLFESPTVRFPWSEIGAAMDRVIDLGARTQPGDVTLKGPWAACRRCAPYVRKGDRKGLAHRCALILRAKHPETLDTPLDVLERGVRRVHEEFWARRGGA